MDTLSSHEDILKKMRMRDLDPKLQIKVVEFASKAGYEKTITVSTKLNFLVKIYNAEKAKEKADKRALKRAEKMIMTLSSMRLDLKGQKKEVEKQTKEKRPLPYASQSSSMSVSKKLRELFLSVGITDEAFMVNAVDILGELSVKTRIDMALGHLGSEAAKETFGKNPDLLLEPNMKKFSESLKDANKKAVTANIRKFNKKHGFFKRLFAGNKLEAEYKAITHPNAEGLEKTIEELESDVAELQVKAAGARTKWELVSQESEERTKKLDPLRSDLRNLENFQEDLASTAIALVDSEAIVKSLGKTSDFYEVASALDIDVDSLVDMLGGSSKRQKLDDLLTSKISALSKQIDMITKRHGAIDDRLERAANESRRLDSELNEAQSELAELRGASEKT